MPPSENPYESPRIPDPVQPPLPMDAAAPRHGWKFVLLGIAIICGLTSMVPWLAVIFAILSAPAFLRYFVYGWKRPHATPWERTTSQTAGIMGSVGFGLSILAAAAGAFLGTCSVASWTVAFTGLGDAIAGKTGTGVDGFIKVVIVIGVLVGATAALASLVWLVNFYYMAPNERFKKNSNAS